MEATANGRERGVGSVEVPPGGGVPPEPATPIGVDTDPDRLDRVLTVPNGITVVRLACIPLFVWLLFGARRQTDAAVLLGALGATDWIDGQVARRWHQVST
ncbi:MAG: CDP-alcohol phosphatidyltransferase family protein, partial [Actinomycetota bacterium]|nr:CDP-alcohol phosphatidyltransferase family protein [Actinomycetota bacterium]